MDSEHPGGNVLQQTGTIFVHIQGNILTKFHKDWTISVTFKNIIGTNLLTKFHEDHTINVASRVKNAPPPGAHVFQPTGTIFHLINDFIGTNVLTKLLVYDDRTINTARRVLTRKNAPPPGSYVFQPSGIIFELVQDIIRMNLLTKFHEDRTINVASRMKNAPPLYNHVFQANETIFELIQDIIETNLNSHIRKNAPLPDRKINVASRVITRKNAPPPGGH
ncbi:hypothetical protein DPMN_177271, partial [Dreissena polymorpha]